MKPPTLDYAKPAARQTQWLVWGVQMTVMAVFAATITLVVVVVMPRFRGIFRDFKIELPELTRVLLTVCELLQNVGGIVGLWVVLLGLPCLTLLRPPEHPRRAIVLTLVLGVVVFAGIATVVIAGLILPLFSLIEGLSGAEPR